MLAANGPQETTEAALRRIFRRLYELGMEAEREAGRAPAGHLRQARLAAGDPRQAVIATETEAEQKQP